MLLQVCLITFIVNFAHSQSGGVAEKGNLDDLISNVFDPNAGRAEGGDAAKVMKIFL